MTRRALSRWSWAVVTLAALWLLGLLTTAAAAQEAPASQAHARSAPVVMILLDSHQSWPGKGIPEKRKVAALHYVSSLPSYVRVGLITFAVNWKRVLSPALDRSRLFQALRSAQSDQGATSSGIYDAIIGAESLLRQFGPAPGRLVILSNAEKVISRPSFSPTVPIDVVPWRYDNDDNIVELQALASASRGRVAAPTHAPTLAKVFLTPATPPAPAPSRSAAAPAHRAIGSPWLLIGALACLFLALLLIAMRVLGRLGVGKRRTALAAEIGRYGPRHAPVPEENTEGTVARTAVGVTTQVLRSSNVETGLVRRLDLAGIGRKPGEWVLLGFSACAVLSVMLTLLFGNAVVGVLAGVAAGYLGMRLIVSVRISRRQNAFRDQLPDVLQLIASSLRAGLSLPQALDAVVREDNQPAAGEFSRALAEARIGANLEDALDAVAARMDSVDLRWTVMAIRIQREVGGNLAEVLSQTVATMRERANLRRHVRALSAEGRLSGYILIALPLLLAGVLLLIAGSYLRPLWTTPIGVLLVIGSAVLFVIGVFWMRAAVKVEV